MYYTCGVSRPSTTNGVDAIHVWANHNRCNTVGVKKSYCYCFIVCCLNDVCIPFPCCLAPCNRYGNNFRCSVLYTNSTADC